MEKSQAEGSANHAAHARRILVVDDNRDLADSSVILLNLEGYEARAVYSGNEALSALSVYAPDVMLLDIGLPDLDGYEVARRIRQQSSTSLLLIAMTGWDEPEDKRRAVEAGFDHHLTKPVEMSALTAVLSR